MGYWEIFRTSKVLLVEVKLGATLDGGGVFVAGLVQRVRQRLGTTEEDSHVSTWVLLGNITENLVKVGPAVVRGGLEASEGIPAVSTVEDDVPDLVGLQTACQEHADLQEIANILSLQSLQQILEPLESLWGRKTIK